MSNTNETPKEIWVNTADLEFIKRNVCETADVKVDPNLIDEDFETAYILKSFHESEMERVKGEMQKEIDLLKSGTHTFVADNILYAQKTCDCKLILSATANFLCHGQCKY